MSGSHPSFVVRTATVADIPVLAHHRVGMFRDMGHLSPAAEEPLARATVGYLGHAIPSGEYLGWVAEAAESEARQPIGGAGAQIRAILPRPASNAEIELGPEAIVLNVYVEPGWRRRGVAEALMRELLARLAERKIRRIVLHASDAGRALYERLGFTATNEMRLTASSVERPRSGHRG